jgi:hypothetical protein
MGVALKQQGKLYDRPQPHEEQKMDRLHEEIYTAPGAGETVFPVVRAWREREHQKKVCSARRLLLLLWLMMRSLHMIGRE